METRRTRPKSRRFAQGQWGEWTDYDGKWRGWNACWLGDGKHRRGGVVRMEGVLPDASWPLETTDIRIPLALLRKPFGGYDPKGAAVLLFDFVGLNPEQVQREYTITIEKMWLAE